MAYGTAARSNDKESKQRSKQNQLQDEEKILHQIDYHVCKLEDGMEAAVMPIFSGFISFIDSIIATPLVLGRTLAVVLCFSGDFVMDGGDALRSWAEYFRVLYIGSRA